MGVRAFPVAGCLSSYEDCAALVSESKALMGRVNILVNNAAVFHKDSLLTATEEKILTEWRSNCLVPVMLTRAFALSLLGTAIPQRSSPGRGRARVRGKIVNLLDRRIAGNETGCMPYLLSKKALAEFTRDAALELAPRFTVNGVAPGAVLPPRRTERVMDLAGDAPLDRRCTPHDVTSAVVYLLENDAVTGQTVFVDGGQHLLSSQSART